MFTKTFSWSWLKSKKEEKGSLVDTYNGKEHEQLLEIVEKVVKNTIYSNGIGTVIFKDGDVFSKEIDFEKMQLIKDCISKEEVYDLFTPIVIKEETEDDFEKEVQVNFLEYKQEVLDLLGKDFNEKNGLFYYKTISLPIDSLILNSLIEAKKESKEDVFEGLLAFWLKLCLNPVKSSREDLLAFCRENDIQITKNGNMVLYRNLVSVENTNTTFVEFVSNEYFKIKSQKKSPRNYHIWQSLESKEYLRLKNDRFPGDTEDTWEDLGNVFDLYTNLSTLKDNNFTSWHNKGKYSIKIGSLYKIEDSEINLSNTVCHSGGIHCANVSYDYSSYGHTKVIVLVSPSKPTTVPLQDRGKLRTTEMFICCINPNNYGVHYEKDNLDVFDEEYNQISILELEEAIGNKSFEILEVTDINNKTEISPIAILDLTTIKNNISKRIINF